MNIPDDVKKGFLIMVGILAALFVIGFLSGLVKK